MLLIFSIFMIYDTLSISLLTADDKCAPLEDDSTTLALLNVTWKLEPFFRVSRSRSVINKNKYVILRI